MNRENINNAIFNASSELETAIAILNSLCPALSREQEKQVNGVLWLLESAETQLDIYIGLS